MKGTLGCFSLMRRDFICNAVMKALEDDALISRRKLFILPFEHVCVVCFVALHVKMKRSCSFCVVRWKRFEVCRVVACFVVLSFEFSHLQLKNKTLQ